MDSIEKWQKRNRDSCLGCLLYGTIGIVFTLIGIGAFLIWILYY